MRAHTWFVEHREDYAVGGLEPAERTAFRDHLRRCPECQAAVEAIEHDLRWLPLGVPAAAVPPGLVHRLTTGVLESRANRRRWALPVGLAAAAVVAAGLAVERWTGVVARDRQIERLRVQLTHGETRLAATLDTLSSIRRANRVLQAQLLVGGTRATVVVFEEEERHQWTVVVHGLPPAPVGERYALWWVCEKGMRQGAALPAGQGAAVLVIAKPTDLGAVLSASLTQESESMSGGMPTSKREIGALEL